MKLTSPLVDDVILVDDLSKDDTVEVGRKLGIKAHHRS
jgi:glycosyltransferase involved in cell wall biosynthesis